MQHIEDRQTNTHDIKIVYCHLRRDRHFLRRAGNKQCNAVFPENQHKNRNDDRGQQSDPRCGVHTLFHAVQKPRAEILPDIRCHGVAERNGGNLQNTVQLIRCRKARHEQRAVAVDDRLHHHAAHGDDNILCGDRRTESQKALCYFRIEPEILFFQADDLHVQHSAQTVKRCEKLCDDRCDDRTRNAPVEHHNKQQIKPDIQNRCNDHGIQRRFAVAERAQDACKHVIRHDDGYTRKHDA